MKVNDKPIIVEEIFNANVVTVWKAITNVEEMQQWFFENIQDFKAEVGFKTQFNVQSEERNFMHLWTITEVETLKKIVYNWKYENYEGDSFVSFELFEETNKTKLKLSTIITENFPDDIPEFNSESCKNGWEYFIQNKLKKFIEKN